jgi:predicted DNA-binding transcriptional regulator AlpA
MQASKQAAQYIPLYDKNGGMSVCTVLSLSRTKVRELAKQAADFPQPIQYSPTCLRYKLADVLSWADAQRGKNLFSAAA